MFNQLKAVKDIAKSPGMIKDMVQMQRKLSAEEVEVKHGQIEIRMRGDLKVVELKLEGEVRNDLKDAFNRALQEVQQKIASSMMSG